MSKNKATPQEQIFINNVGNVVIKDVCHPMTLLLRLDAGENLSKEESGIIRRMITPGLDANKCKCDRCSMLYPSGVWWVNQQTRDQVLGSKKKSILKI